MRHAGAYMGTYTIHIFKYFQINYIYNYINRCLKKRNKSVNSKSILIHTTSWLFEWVIYAVHIFTKVYKYIKC